MTQVRPLGAMQRFQNFLAGFKDKQGEYKYRQSLKQLGVNNANSLVVDFMDLMVADSDLARRVEREPDEYFKHFDDAVYRQLGIEDSKYASEIERVYVRFRGLPEAIHLRGVGAEHISRLILIDGIVVRATIIRPLLSKAVFRCKACDSKTTIEQTENIIKYPDTCTNPECRSNRSGARSFELLEKESEFINYQELRVQERPEDLPPGQLPRWLEVALLGDMVDIARPGDRVSITGVVRASKRFLSRGAQLRTYDLVLEGNFVDIAGKELEVIYISPEEEKEILELSRDPRVHEKIVRSIAPSIYGYDDIKEAIMYLLLGGVPKAFPDLISIRGDINLLLIGDPGTAKSQLLQYVARVAPRGLYTSGRGSTAAGLTAAVIRETGGSMTLEAGALVLADKGVCAIDEIDKMRPEDRVAIHEAMAQQSVSIAKGGIVATLNARTAILAAANPALGRYDAYGTVTDNINLPVTILSRFDLIFVIRDLPQSDVDRTMADHILMLHKTGTSPSEPPISPLLLRKFIDYVKHTNPSLSEGAMNRLRDFYLEMRSVSSSPDSEQTPVAITARQLESLVRLAEARARVSLRDEVTVDDAQAVILLMRKSLSQVGIDMTTGRQDIDLIMTGKPKSLRDKLQVVLLTLSNMERDTGMVNEEELYERIIEEFEITRSEADRLISQLLRDGTIYSPRQGFLKKT